MKANWITETISSLFSLPTSINGTSISEACVPSSAYGLSLMERCKRDWSAEKLMKMDEILARIEHLPSPLKEEVFIKMCLSDLVRYQYRTAA